MQAIKREQAHYNLRYTIHYTFILISSIKYYASHNPYHSNTTLGIIHLYIVARYLFNRDEVSIDGGPR